VSSGDPRAASEQPKWSAACSEPSDSRWAVFAASGRERVACAIALSSDDVKGALLHRKEVIDRQLKRFGVVDKCKFAIVTLDSAGKE
jgi:hypothetical protein